MASDNVFLVSPAKQVLAFAGDRKIGRSIADTMPKIHQKVIRKSYVPGIGKSGKLAASSETAKNADDSQNMLETTASNIPLSFGTKNWTTISTQIGATALLPCAVHAIGEGMVSYTSKRRWRTVVLSLFRCDLVLLVSVRVPSWYTTTSGAIFILWR